MRTLLPALTVALSVALFTNIGKAQYAAPGAGYDYRTYAGGYQQAPQGYAPQPNYYNTAATTYQNAQAPVQQPVRYQPIQQPVAYAPAAQPVSAPQYMFQASYGHGHAKASSGCGCNAGGSAYGDSAPGYGHSGYGYASYGYAGQGYAGQGYGSYAPVSYGYQPMQPFMGSGCGCCPQPMTCCPTESCCSKKRFKLFSKCGFNPHSPDRN